MMTTWTAHSTKRRLYATLFACSVALGSASAQPSAACATTYRVVSQRWDAVLKTNLETRQNCAHPDWPTQLIATHSATPLTSRPPQRNQNVQPLLVRAGDQVRLWMEDGPVRIEMTGQAEQSARNGEHITVRITRPSDDAGLAVKDIPGTVRGPGDVEMQRWR